MRWIFDLAWLGLLVFMGGTWPLMPEMVGAPHKALPRDLHMALMMGVAVFCPWLATRGAVLLARQYPAGLNIPNKEFWMAPERREQTLMALRQRFFPLGLLLVLLLAGLHYREVQHGQTAWPVVPPALWIAGTALLCASFTAWVATTASHFKALPAPVSAVEPRRFDASRSDELVWRESQPMWALLVLMPAAGLLVWGVTAGTHLAGPMAALALALQLPLLLFGRMVTEVRGDSLQWRFGWLGLPRWRRQLDDIVAVEPARSRPLEGWGIRITGEGMLYNSHGLQAVRVTQRNGRRLRLGTQDPQRLIQALQPRIARAAR